MTEWLNDKITRLATKLGKPNEVIASEINKLVEGGKTEKQAVLTFQSANSLRLASPEPAEYQVRIIGKQEPKKQTGKDGTPITVASADGIIDLEGVPKPVQMTFWNAVNLYSELKLGVVSKIRGRLVTKGRSLALVGIDSVVLGTQEAVTAIKDMEKKGITLPTSDKARSFAGQSRLYKGTVSKVIQKDGGRIGLEVTNVETPEIAPVTVWASGFDTPCQEVVDELSLLEQGDEVLLYGYTNVKPDKVSINLRGLFKV